jgi:hypothetical protein
VGREGGKGGRGRERDSKGTDMSLQRDQLNPGGGGGCCCEGSGNEAKRRVS